MAAFGIHVNVVYTISFYNPCMDSQTFSHICLNTTLLLAEAHPHVSYQAVRNSKLEFDIVCIQASELQSAHESQKVVEFQI